MPYLKKLLFISTLSVLFFVSSQNVFSSDFGYKYFKDNNTGKYGYKDLSGNIVIPANFNFAEPFSEDLASVQIGKYPDSKWGFINKKGEFVISAKFDQTGNFSEGLASVGIGEIFIDPLGGESYNNRKWGYINKKGRLVIPMKFDVAFDFINGIAEVHIEGYKVKINTKGDEVSLREKLYN